MPYTIGITKILYCNKMSTDHTNIKNMIDILNKETQNIKDIQMLDNLIDVEQMLYKRKQYLQKMCKYIDDICNKCTITRFNECEHNWEVDLADYEPCRTNLICKKCGLGDRGY
jgi:hemerythrin-like domain-containing protein